MKICEKHRSHVKLVPSVVLFGLLAGCAAGVSPPAGQQYSFEEVPPAMILCEPIDRSGVEASVRLQVSPDRITPNDGNAMLSSTTISWSGGEITSLEIIEPETCDVRRAFLPTAGQSTFTWNGEADDGEALNPGAYLVRVRERSGATRFSAVVIGYRDDACSFPGTSQVSQTNYSFESRQPSMAPTRRLDTRTGGRMCITVTGEENEAFAPMVMVNGATVLNSSHVDGDIRRISIGADVGPAPAVTVGGVGNFTVTVGVIPGVDDGVSNITPTAFSCAGRLQSRTNSMYPELRRRPVLRGGVPVTCMARFGPRPDEESGDIVALMTRQSPTGSSFSDVEPFIPDVDLVPYRAMLPNIPGMQGRGPGFVDPGDMKPTPPTTGLGELVWVEGFTRPDGTFFIPFTEADLEKQHIHPDQPLLYISANCGNVGLCGYAASGDSSESVAGAQHLRIINVPDYHDDVLEARLITNARPTDPFDADEDGQRINDLPIVIHEPFDPLGEDSTDYMVWLLGGQPNLLENADDEAIGLDQQCGEMPREKRCVPFREDCRWTPECVNSGVPGEVSCLQTNMLKILLDNGYDVWLVNNAAYDLTPARTAAVAPRLYQSVQDYPGVDSDRTIAVAGLSAGGVAARIALRMWERKDELPVINGEQLELLNLIGADEINDAPDQVGLYLSYDAPHRGALLPVTLQAFLKDDQIPRSQSLTDLVNSDTASQLLKNYVLAETDTPCFVGEEQARDCTLYERTPENEALDLGILLGQSIIGGDDVSRDGLDQLIEESIDKLSIDGTSILDALAPDGLPKTIPSFAISNGPFDQQTRTLSSDLVLHVKISVLDDRDQYMKTTIQQPPGSTLPLCQANEIRSPMETFFFNEFLADYCESKCGVLGWFCKRACFIGGGVIPLPRQRAIVDVSVPPVADAPTFIPTESALLAPRDVPDVPAVNLEDALWRTDEGPYFHFEVTEEACKFTMFQLDGYLKNDKDGYPACTNSILGDCAAGGRQPGQLVDPANAMASRPELFCDCNDDDADINPGTEKGCRLIRRPAPVDLSNRSRLSLQ